MCLFVFGTDGLSVVVLPDPQVSDIHVVGGTVRRIDEDGGILSNSIR